MQWQVAPDYQDIHSIFIILWFGGFLFDHLNRQVLFGCCTFVAGLAIVLAPWWRRLVALAVCIFISGCATGALDTGGNVWCLDLWGKKSGPFMQALHFMFGLGAFVSPLIAEPFLSPMAQNISNDSIIAASLEVAFGQLIATFSVKGPLHLSKSTGSFVTSTFWGAFMGTRAISIFWATRFSPFSMIFCDLILLLSSSIVLVLFVSSSVEVLWAGSALLGVGTASVFPSLFAWFEQFMRVSNRVSSVFLIACSTGEMLLPLLLGQYIDDWPMVLMYAILTCSISCLCIFLIIWKIASPTMCCDRTVTQQISGNKDQNESQNITGTQFSINNTYI